VHDLAESGSGAAAVLGGWLGLSAADVGDLRVRGIV
jgi:hypothetical protein